ncbi:MAG: thymidylate kinase [Clostridia bacterium]|nr:thymidylate kinase [Clostridia bacterium]
MNKIFVIEGTDGVGKQTQTNELIKRLNQLDISTYTTSFPKYDDLSSGPVREYLSGNISQNPNDISAKAASSFYAVDRYITFKKYIESYYNDNSTVIVFDRYTQSNLIHQGGKLIGEKKNFDKLDEFSNWLYHLEYEDLSLPKPTATIYLYAPVDFTINMTKNRANKITNEAKKDIHESDRTHLQHAAEAGLYFAKKQGWQIIECVKDGTLRTVDDIASEILSIVKKYL